MASLNVGYLFKRKNVSFHLKKYEVFEFIDYVTAISFKNSEGVSLRHILSGSFSGSYANAIDEKDGTSDLSFVTDDIDNAISDNQNRVNFADIRKKKMSKTAKYYLRGSNNGLNVLQNDALITYLDKNIAKKDSEFDEGVFEKSTDISTMYDSIKKTIVAQDEQIMQILTALFKNQMAVQSDLDIDMISKLKENVLIYGPTGTGKTEILKRISKLYSIPIVVEDATSLSETGYQGRKITDMLNDLFLAADGDIELAQRGILVIDEFDKLAEKSGDTQSHVSRLGVQRSLLKLLDGSLFYFDGKRFDTSRLTIVGAGAFTGITGTDDYKFLTSEDFIKYGIMRELIGRFSKTVVMNSLDRNDMIKILKNSDFSPINTYKSLLEILHVKFNFSDEFIEYIADAAVAKNSGARSLKTVFDECISSALFRIFAGEYSEISLIRPDEHNEKPYILTKKK